jgi:hypothetical protein
MSYAYPGIGKTKISLPTNHLRGSKTASSRISLQSLTETNWGGV